MLESTQLAILGRGDTFNTADAAPPEFIAAFESVLQLTQTSEATKELIRHKISSLLVQHKRSETLSKEEQQALKSLKADKDIIILSADKSRSTVVLDKSDYQKKALSLLDDPQSYKLCPASEMKNLLTQINKSLAELRANWAITAKDWFHMKPSDSAAARFYGLPKVPKANIPLRPVVSLRGTPTCGLAKWMFARLKFLAEGSPTTVASANQFLERLKHLKLEPDESMVSFDVVSLFTSIPQQLAIDVVRQLLADRYNEINNPLKTEHLMELLRQGESSRTRRRHVRQDATEILIYISEKVGRMVPSDTSSSCTSSGSSTTSIEPSPSFSSLLTQPVAEGKPTLLESLANWAARSQTAHTHVNSLLNILKPLHPELPSDARTLLASASNSATFTAMDSALLNVPADASHHEACPDCCSHTLGQNTLVVAAASDGQTAVRVNVAYEPPPVALGTHVRLRYIRRKPSDRRLSAGNDGLPTNAGRRNGP
ncbi:hypothetical protein SprV_0301092500 [Sparganum proliferum]